MCGGATVSWYSRTQKCVTLSTSEVRDVVDNGNDLRSTFRRFEGVWCFMVPQAGMLCVPVIRVACSLRTTQSSNRIQNTSMFDTILFGN